jgi:hypothetical protein
VRARRMALNDVTRILTAALALLLISAGDSAAQTRGVLHGTVLDSLTSVPLIDALVTAICSGCIGRNSTDSTGRYRIDTLPAGAVTVVVHCPSRTLLGRELLQQEITVAESADTRFDVRVPPGACAEPPYAERSGTYRGHYTPGFESSRFIPCPDSTVGLTVGLLPGKRLFPPSAWAVFSPRAREQGAPAWPTDAPRDDWGNPTFFVLWQGTLRGPGTYGHMGVSEFSFTVDSVLVVRRPSGSDCR